MPKEEEVHVVMHPVITYEYCRAGRITPWLSVHLLVCSFSFYFSVNWVSHFRNDYTFFSLGANNFHWGEKKINKSTYIFCIRYPQQQKSSQHHKCLLHSLFSDHNKCFSNINSFNIFYENVLGSHNKTWCTSFGPPSYC